MLRQQDDGFDPLWEVHYLSSSYVLIGSDDPKDSERPTEREGRCIR